MSLSSPVSVQLSAAQLDALAEDLGTFPPQSQRRGREYASAGRVGLVNRGDAGFDAAVTGRDVYQCSWVWEAGHWESDCTCPAAPYCKHAYALASVVLAMSDAARGRHDARVHRLVPAALVDDAALPRAAAPVAKISLIDRLRAAPDHWSRYQCFQSMVQPARTRGLYVYHHDLDDSLHEDDPDMMCWRLAGILADLPEEVFPPGLVPYRHRADLQARFAERERSVLSATLLSWAGSQRRIAERQVRVVLGFDVGADQMVRITAETRVSTARLQDEPRTPAQLQQLRTELRRSPDAFTAEMAAILEWAVERATEVGSFYLPDPRETRQRLSGTQLRSLLSRLAGSPLVTWGARLDPELAQRGGVSAGAAVHAGEPVRVLPTCVARGGDLVIELACVWADDRQRPLREVVHVRSERGSTSTQPSYVLADGYLHAVTQEPPIELVDYFATASTLPVPFGERETVLGTLTASFPHLQRVVAGHTRHYNLQPLVAMDLRDDDWLQVRIYARSRATWMPSDPLAAEDVVFEYTPAGRWARLTTQPTASALPEVLDDIPASQAPPPPGPPGAAPMEWPPPPESPIEPAEAWFETPQPDLVAPVLGWMTALDLRPGRKGRPGGRIPGWSDAHVGWWQRFTRRTAAVFAEVWETRPPVVAFFGTARIRRMLSGEMRVWPKLKIESSGVDWFAVSAEWEAEGLRLSDDDLALLRNATTRFVKISTGWVQREAAELHDGAAEILADLGIEAGGGPQRLSVWQLAGASAASLAALEQFGADPETLAAVQRLREEIHSFQGLPIIPSPPGLEGELRPYQARGLDFLTYTGSIGVGAVLADDMGLGKTLQALAWLLHLRHQDPEGGPCLVVCPASVVHNWQREAERFAPGLRVLLLTSGKTRHELRSAIPEHDLVVTNYALLRRDVEAWREAQLRAVIFDEAQQIKNPDAAVTHAAAAVPARYRLALTGTPLENRALDLFSIVEVINPGYLGRRSRFQLRFDKPDAPRHVRALLSAKLRPILLRRAKKEVAPELPERIEEQWDCEMTAAQRLIYLTEVKRSRAMIDRLAETRGGIAQNKIHILAALTRLRQICCHPQLVGGRADAGSGKFESLFELLEPILAEGHKVLVFSQFVACIRLLRAELKARDIAHHVLTGQSTKRAAIVDAFQEDPKPSVFLISLKAGGTGLNLTAASYVVLFDPWWNPAVEAQAIDRTHRIGQDRTVIAYRLITRGTIEEKIYQLQQRKAALVRDILGEEGFARTLTRDDLDYLLEET